ncbi:MAG: response regulator transcription factor [Chitinophagales bacterium]|jgi:DNA-binding LytR/AlgR family response regulator|nr:response regulator transcription factor [Chitinophagales bacterium]
MKIIIIEDEPLAAKRLQKLFLELEKDAEVLAMFDSVKRSVDWLSKNTAPDLLLMDIQLSDGLCFDIFSGVNIETPVIFTTAYDEFALRAFKVNSVDYLLKPIDKEELQKAINKFKTQSGINSAGISSEQMNNVIEILTKQHHQYKTRFLVKFGDRLEPISINDIQYFFAEEKLTFLVMLQGKKLVIDPSLDELETQLDPMQFFRLNRQYLASIHSIGNIFTHLNGKLKVQVKGLEKEEIFVSRERAPEFKKWLDR